MRYEIKNIEKDTEKKTATLQMSFDGNQILAIRRIIGGSPSYCFTTEEGEPLMAKVVFNSLGYFHKSDIEEELERIYVKRCLGLNFSDSSNTD